MRNVTLLLLVFCTACLATATEPPSDSENAFARPRLGQAIERPVGRPKLVVIFGQSNAGSQGIASELAPADADLAAPYVTVPFTETIGYYVSATQPDFVTYPLAPLAAEPGIDGQVRFGVELSMARALDEAEPDQWVVVKYSASATSLCGEWNPDGAFPAAGANLFDLQLDAVRAARDATQSEIAAFVWIQGEKDASGTTPSRCAYQYGDRLNALVGRERAALGADASVPFFYGRLNIHFPEAGRDAVRAGQEADQTATQIMIDQDPYPQRSDLTHYTAEGYVELGKAYADAILARQL